MAAFDLTTPFGTRVANRLQNEQIIWLTTVRRDGTPQPSPVWFFWDGESVVIYSRPNTQKLRNIAQNPTVSLSFNSDAGGGNIVVLTGTAHVDEAAPLATAIPDYIEKYRQGIANINMTPETMAASYSTAIRVTLRDMRGF